MARYEPATRIAATAAICFASHDDVRDAAKLFGYRLLGGLILRRADRLPEAFFDEVRRCASMRQAAESRRKSA